MIVLQILEAAADVLLIVSIVWFIATEVPHNWKIDTRRAVRTFIGFVAVVFTYGIVMTSSHLYHLFW